MRFSEVVGHSTIKEKFNELIAEKRLPHAMMLLGNEGVGGLALALAIAQNVVCERRNNNALSDGGMFGETLPKVELKDACGTCFACQKAAKLIHPDIYFTYPVYTKKTNAPALSSDFTQEWRKAVTDNPYQNNTEWLRVIEAENKLGNISVHECHEIIRRVHLKPYEAPYKIQIIWLAEYLKETGNTLLKVIEEPPSDTLFIFVVEQSEQILGTILSRTQITKLPPISDDDLTDFLRQHFQLETEQAKRIAKISEGNLNRARIYALGGNNEYESLLQSWFSTANRLLNPKFMGESSKQLQDLSDVFMKLGRENQKAFIQYGLWFLREVLLLNQGLHSEKLDGSELAFAQKFTGVMNIDKLSNLQKILSEFHYHIERNANPKIAFYSTSFRFFRIFTGK